MPDNRGAEKRNRFVAEYLKDMNATKAAIRAGYSARTAGSQAHDLLKRPDVAAKVQAALAKVYQRSELTRERWLKELEAIGFADMADMATWTGESVSFTPSANLADGQTRAVQAVTKKVTYTKSGDTIEEMELKLHDKKAALVAIGKAMGWVTEKVEHSGSISLDDALKKLEKPEGGEGGESKTE